MNTVVVLKEVSIRLWLHYVVNNEVFWIHSPAISDSQRYSMEVLSHGVSHIGDLHVSPHVHTCVPAAFTSTHNLRVRVEGCSSGLLSVAENAGIGQK